MENNEILKDEDFKEYLGSLPVNIQNALISEGVSQAITSIAEQFSLNSVRDDFGNEIMLIMMGIEPMVNLEKNIAERFGKNTEEAQAIGETIRKEVFLPIQESLNSIHDIPSAEKDLLKNTIEENEGLANVSSTPSLTKRELPYTPNPTSTNSMPENLSLDYTPGKSLKETLLGKEVPAEKNTLIQKEKTSFERRLAGFNDDDQDTVSPKTSAPDPYREGV